MGKGEFKHVTLESIIEALQSALCPNDSDTDLTMYLAAMMPIEAIAEYYKLAGRFPTRAAEQVRRNWVTAYEERQQPPDQEEGRRRLGCVQSILHNLKDDADIESPTHHDYTLNMGFPNCFDGYKFFCRAASASFRAKVDSNAGRLSLLTDKEKAQLLDIELAWAISIRLSPVPLECKEVLDAEDEDVPRKRRKVHFADEEDKIPDIDMNAIPDIPDIQADFDPCDVIAKPLSTQLLARVVFIVKEMGEMTWEQVLEAIDCEKIVPDTVMQVKSANCPDVSKFIKEMGWISPKFTMASYFFGNVFALHLSTKACGRPALRERDLNLLRYIYKERSYSLEGIKDLIIRGIINRRSQIKVTGIDAIPYKQKRDNHFLYLYSYCDNAAPTILLPYFDRHYSKVDDVSRRELSRHVNPGVFLQETRPPENPSLNHAEAAPPSSCCFRCGRGHLDGHCMDYGDLDLHDIFCKKCGHAEQWGKACSFCGHYNGIVCSSCFTVLDVTNRQEWLNRKCVSCLSHRPGFGLDVRSREFYRDAYEDNTAPPPITYDLTQLEEHKQIAFNQLWYGFDVDAILNVLAPQFGREGLINAFADPLLSAQNRIPNDLRKQIFAPREGSYTERLKRLNSLYSNPEVSSNIKLYEALFYGVYLSVVYAEGMYYTAPFFVSQAPESDFIQYIQARKVFLKKYYPTLTPASAWIFHRFLIEGAANAFVMHETFKNELRDLSNPFVMLYHFRTKNTLAGKPGTEHLTDWDLARIHVSTNFAGWFGQCIYNTLLLQTLNPTLHIENLHQLGVITRQYSVLSAQKQNENLARLEEFEHEYAKKHDVFARDVSEDETEFLRLIKLNEVLSAEREEIEQQQELERLRNVGQPNDPIQIDSDSDEPEVVDVSWTSSGEDEDEDENEDD